MNRNHWHKVDGCFQVNPMWSGNNIIHTSSVCAWQNRNENIYLFSMNLMQKIDENTSSRSKWIRTQSESERFVFFLYFFFFVTLRDKTAAHECVEYIQNKWRENKKKTQIINKANIGSIDSKCFRMIEYGKMYVVWCSNVICENLQW